MPRPCSGAITQPPRPCPASGAIPLSFENLIINSTRWVIYNGRELDLPRREFDLLYVLSSQAGRVLTHEQLRYYVWGDDFPATKPTPFPSEA